jgi:hypothetical protein
MATTTNYGWTTPDDTALVKDGAAAIRTLGTSVDTTTKALNPSTTLGDIEYRSSTANTNTRLAIGSTGQVLTVAGGVPTWATSDDANAIQNALLTTTGDTIYASGASTPARLGIGSTGQVLTVAAGVPSWATPAAAGGGLDLISTTSFSNVASQSVNDVFSATYDNYVIKLNSTTVATSNGRIDLRLRVGGTDTSTGYKLQRIAAASTTITGSRNTGASEWQLIGYLAPAFNNEFTLNIANPFKTVVTTGLSNSVLIGDGNIETQINAYGLNNTTSYTGFTLIPETNMTGSVSVYGYKK